eukprot:SAG11_NODE_7220_length_1176_cov_1.794800_1_plen_196_part_01
MPVTTSIDDSILASGRHHAAQACLGQQLAPSEMRALQLELLPEELLASHLVLSLAARDLIALAAASKLLRRVVRLAPIRCIRLRNISRGPRRRELWLQLLRTLASRCPNAAGLELTMCDIPSCAVAALTAGYPHGPEVAGPPATDGATPPPPPLFPALQRLALIKCYHIKSEPAASPPPRSPSPDVPEPAPEPFYY